MYNTQLYKSRFQYCPPRIHPALHSFVTLSLSPIENELPFRFRLWFALVLIPNNSLIPSTINTKNKLADTTVDISASPPEDNRWKIGPVSHFWCSSSVCTAHQRSHTTTRLGTTFISLTLHPKGTQPESPLSKDSIPSIHLSSSMTSSQLFGMASHLKKETFPSWCPSDSSAATSVLDP